MSSLVPLYLPILYSQHFFGGCVQWKGCRASVSVRRAFSSLFSVGKNTVACWREPVLLISILHTCQKIFETNAKAFALTIKENKNLHKEILKDSSLALNLSFFFMTKYFLLLSLHVN